MSLVTIILTLILMVWIPVLLWYLSVRKYESLEKIPGPKPLPVIGNAHHLGNSPRALLENFVRLHKKYGGIFKLFIGSEVRVVFAKPDNIQHILSSNIHINKSDQYDLLKPWLGEGLVTSGGAKWKSRRKMITPTFHFKILEKFVEVFNSQSDILMGILSRNTNKIIDVSSFMDMYALDVICETAMGIKIDAQKSGNNEFVEATREMSEINMIRFFSSWKRNELLLKHFAPGTYKQFKKCLSILHGFTNDVIKKRRQQFRNETSNVQSDDVGRKPKMALLDLLLESENSNLLSNEDIREEIDTFMFAGHHTISTSAAFAMLCLADNQDVQKKLHQEIAETIGSDTESPVTMEQLPDMKYLDMFIKEVERYYPIAPFIERRVEEDTVIDGVTYPAGITIFMFLYGLHRDQDLFSDPEKFDPDRFLQENTAQRHPYAYVPFSAGSRNCIGQRFAILELKVTIAKIVRKFHVLPSPGFRPVLGLKATLKSLNGIRIELKRR